VTLQEALVGVGLRFEHTPPDAVNLLRKEEVLLLPEPAPAFATDPKNTPCLAYPIETEHQPKVGLILRNLLQGKDRRHLDVIFPEFLPNNQALFYGLHSNLTEIYQTSSVILVEGPKDALQLISYGLPAVAYLTSNPSPDQIRILRRYATRVFWIPDNEELQTTRRAAREKARALMSQFFSLKVHQLTQVKDPADLFKCPEELFHTYSSARTWLSK